MCIAPARVGSRGRGRTHCAALSSANGCHSQREPVVLGYVEARRRKLCSIIASFGSPVMVENISPSPPTSPKALPRAREPIRWSRRATFWMIAFPHLAHWRSRSSASRNRVSRRLTVALPRTPSSRMALRSRRPPPKNPRQSKAARRDHRQGRRRDEGRLGCSAGLSCKAEPR
jgi:hypothetical protein